MVSHCDIFRKTGDEFLWIEVVDDFEAAKALVGILGKEVPGEYMILNQRTGTKTVIRIAAAPSASRGSA